MDDRMPTIKQLLELAYQRGKELRISPEHVRRLVEQQRAEDARVAKRRKRRKPQ